jgi:hypothetical protein
MVPTNVALDRAPVARRQSIVGQDANQGSAYVTEMVGKCRIFRTVGCIFLVSFLVYINSFFGYAILLFASTILGSSC